MNSETRLASLVETYKSLNMKFRNARESGPARDIVRRMRDDEIAFSQALKDSLTGIGTDLGEPGEVDGTDTTLAQLISQFGNARATTLNLLKGIKSDSVWTDQLADGSTIEQHVDELIQSDTNQLAKLADLVRA